MRRIRLAATVLVVLMLAVCLWQTRPSYTEKDSGGADLPQINSLSVVKTYSKARAVSDRIKGTAWYKGDFNGFQPVDDTPMLVFNADGTGELRLENSADVMIFTYEVVDEHRMKLTDNSNGSAPVLDEGWTELYFGLFSFYGTDVDIMTVRANEICKLYSKPAQRLENSSVRYSNGVVFTDLPPFADSAQLEKRMSDTQWFQTDYESFQPADNPPVIIFNADGTGELWLHSGDGCSFTYFTYEATDGGCLMLFDDGDGISKPLDENWSKLHVSFSRWYGTDVDVMTVQTRDGTVYKFFSAMAERLPDSSIKLSDGTVVSPPQD